MANHKSSIKRIKQSATRRLRNRYQLKTAKTLIKKIRIATSQADANVLLPNVFSKIDRLAKKNIIHKNKAANQKSKLARFVNKLA